MKLHAANLISMLALTTAQKVQLASGRVERFLADRDVLASELATHATYADGFWTALDGVVYDITNFEHPGGVDYILPVGGGQADDLYMKAYNAKYHPYTIAEVVSLPGVSRIGPLVLDPAAAPAQAPAPTSNGSAIGHYFYGFTTMMMVIVSLA